MTPMTVIVISVVITIIVLWASVWVIVKGYAYKHTIDTDVNEDVQNRFANERNSDDDDKA
ncbi:YtzI protein [Pueribacillus sp. YX66]|uniref:YtzI protein n=1 Tax=Pueribacillus sp. YX66 TaxID=3229242 RepID=UPI00358CE046